MSTQGRSFADRYSLDVQIQSSVGTPVWRALDQVLKRWVTLYLMPRSDVRSIAVIAACQKAASATPKGAVSIINVIEQGTLRGLATVSAAEEFLGVITEWTEGESLDRRLLRRAEPMPPEHAVDMATTIAMTVAAAHSKNLTHGRLRPHNIILADDDTVTISGFGVEASFLGPDRTNGVQADVQGIGNLLFAMVTGKWPGQATDGLPAAAAAGAVPMPSDVTSPMPPAVDALFLGTQDGTILTIETLLVRLAQPLGQSRSSSSAHDDAQGVVADPSTENSDADIALVDEESADTDIQQDDVVSALTDDSQIAPDDTDALDDADAPVSVAASVAQAPTTVTQAQPPISTWAPLIPDTQHSPTTSAKRADVTAALRKTWRTITGKLRRPNWHRVSSSVRTATLRLRSSRLAKAAGPVAKKAPTPSLPPRFTEALRTPLATPDVTAWQPEPPNARLRAILVACIGVVLFGWLGWKMLTVTVGNNDFALPSPSASIEPSQSASPTPSQSSGPSLSPTPAPDLIPLVSATDFDPYGDGTENPGQAPLAIDGDTSTAWHTTLYKKPIGESQAGVGLIVDLGKSMSVSSVKVFFEAAGAAFSVYVTDDAAPRLRQTQLLGKVKLAGKSERVAADKPLKGRYIVVWLTDLPRVNKGYQAGITQVTVPVR